MEPRRWKEIEAAFSELVELAGVERRNRLAAFGAADPELRAAVESLLAADVDADHRLAPIEAALVSPGANHLGRLAAALADRYHVERELGSGGMATVYLAHDLKHDRAVALKVLKPELAAALGRERFLREVALTAQLDHPHIVPLLDSGDAGGLVYYVMPYVEGESLRDRLDREKQLPVEDALKITQQVADALSYAHSRGIVHRDIKPANILLAGGHARVVDFGIARAVTAAGGTALTETGVAVGTPVYMSPEQASGARELDARSDVYSLASVVYEMLAGQPPYTGATAEAVLARKSLEAVPSLRVVRETVPAGVEQALTRALAKVPADRFATAAEFAEALHRGAHEQRLPTARRIPRRALVVGATAALVTAALALAIRSGSQRAAALSGVVVMPFENRTGDASLEPVSAITADWVAQGLSEPGFLTVYDTRSALAAAHTLGAAATPQAVGRETGAGVVVAGSYFLRGDSLQFQAQIASATDGRILFGIGGVVATRNRPLEGVEQLRQRVLAALASLHDKEVTAFQNTLTHLPTYAAYREYAEGLDLYVREDLEAVRHFERAAALDTSFLVARLWAVQGWMGPRPGNLIAIDSLLEGLQRLRQRLGPFYRAQLDFLVAQRARDYQDAYRAALRMVESAPGSINARREAAYSALRVLRPREALTGLAALDPERGLLRHSPEFWSPVAWSHHLLGEYQRELVAARRGRQLNPPGSHFDFLELRALAALGRTLELDSLVRADLAAVPGQSGLLARAVAGELLAHGHAEAARRLAHYAAELLAGRPPSDQSPQEWLRQRAALGVFTGESEVLDYFALERLAARSLLERAKDEWLHDRAELALLLGDVDAAGNFAAQLGDPDVHGVLLARVAAAQGRHEAARAALQRAERRQLDRWGSLRGLELDRASVLVRMGDVETAMVVLTEGLTRGLIWDSVLGNDGHARPDLAPLWHDPRFRALIKPRG